MSLGLFAWTAIISKNHIISLQGPGYDLPCSIMMFYQGSAGFYPVTVVHVCDTIDIFDLGMVYVSTDHTVKTTLLTVCRQILFKLEHKVHGSFHTMFEISAQRPVAETHASPQPIESGVEPEYDVIGTISQPAQPGCHSSDAIKHVTVYHEIVPAIRTDVFGLVGDLYQAKANAVRNQGPQEFVMITSYEYHTGSTLGMTQHPSHYVGMALFPTPLVALYLPGINDVAYQIQGITGVVLEEIIQSLGFAISCAQMYITDEDRSVCF
jgi:hypothetical protein